MKSFENFLVQLKLIKPLKLLGSSVILIIIVSFFFAKAFPLKSSSTFEFTSIYEKLFITVVFAPIVETYLIQQLIILNTLKYTKKNSLFALILSALVFGAIHYYSIFYMIKTFISGSIYGTIFLTYRETLNTAFWFVVITHASYNLFAVVINAFF